jgi:hypothetical protein
MKRVVPDETLRGQIRAEFPSSCHSSISSK